MGITGKTTFLLSEAEARHVAESRIEIDALIVKITDAQRAYRAVKEEIFSSRNIPREEREQYLITNDLAVLLQSRPATAIS
jgi:hypothetical protein